MRSIAIQKPRHCCRLHIEPRQWFQFLGCGGCFRVCSATSFQAAWGVVKYTTLNNAYRYHLKYTTLNKERRSTANQAWSCTVAIIISITQWLLYLFAVLCMLLALGKSEGASIAQRAYRLLKTLTFGPLSSWWPHHGDSVAHQVDESVGVIEELTIGQRQSKFSHFCVTLPCQTRVMFEFHGPTFGANECKWTHSRALRWYTWTPKHAGPWNPWIFVGIFNK